MIMYENRTFLMKMFINIIKKWEFVHNAIKFITIFKKLTKNV